MLSFMNSVPKYNGNPEKILEWCKNLETHLFNNDWEMIPNNAVKRMLLSCIAGSARQEIMLLHPTGLAFEGYETKCFSQSC